MKKHFFVTFMLIFSLVGSLFAQERAITGTITSAEDGLSLPGVNVLVKGTSIGVMTNADGQYTITVPSDAQTLEFSYIGMIPQEVVIGSSSVIDVVLQLSVQALDEVVVTALGIRKTEKSLGYSVTEVSGDNFVEARETNIANSLVGRVAGVNVSKQATGPAGSSRVIIRGNTSLTGNNQPLYIVDGVPIDNRNLGAAGMWGGTDKGDGISSLNPDDIETMSVLKGGSAAALYGSRASNGVILITTKSGKKSKGLSVEVNSNYTFDKGVSYLDYQTEYGQGTKGHAPTNLAEANQDGPGGANLHTQSFGGILNDASVIQFDGVSRPYSYAGDPMDQFYRTGSTFTNTVSLLGGNEAANFRVSASDLSNESIIPNSGLKKNTFNVNTNFKLSKFSGSIAGTYIMEDVKNSPRVNDVPRNVNMAIRYWPTSVPVNIAEGDPDKIGADPVTGLELLPSYNTWGGNPYWAAYQSVNDRTKDRMLGNMRLRYDPTDWLFIQGRMGLDKYFTSITDITPTGQAYSPAGSMALQFREYTQTNNELIIGLDKALDMGLGINAMVGANMMESSMEYRAQNGSVFAIPFFHSIQNTTNKSHSVSQVNDGINSVFYSAEVSYNSIYLTTTGRQDWFSTLDGASIFYPSVSLSAVVSDMVDISAIDFLKVRGAWSQVGGATTPYATSFNYALGNPHLGNAQGYINGNVVPNKELVPLLATEI
ncbi:MAG: SusC/RagA family TonB-linked outer membrane protein, partial [Bacteroidales bacterium]|nr:SusC/RagA family TonB-linked outer membrane protein [Bacteroidales bacterium]